MIGLKEVQVRPQGQGPLEFESYYDRIERGHRTTLTANNKKFESYYDRIERGAVRDGDNVSHRLNRTMIGLKEVGASFAAFKQNAFESYYDRIESVLFLDYIPLVLEFESYYDRIERSQPDPPDGLLAMFESYYDRIERRPDQ